MNFRNVCSRLIELATRWRAFAAAAVFELDPGRLTVLHDDPLDAVLQEHAPARLRERLPDRVRERVRAADAEVPVVDLSDKQRERDSEALAVGGVSGDGGVERQVRLHLRVLEVLIEELVDAHAAEVNAEELALAFDAPGDERLRDVLHRYRRRVHQREEDHVEVALGFLVQAPERVRILLRKPGDRGAGLLEVRVHRERRAVREDRGHLHRRADVPQAVLAGQFEVIVDGADADERVVVAVNVVQEAGPGQLLGTEPAALLCPLLEDRHVPAAPGQVSAEGHAVVTGTNDNRVVGGISHRPCPRIRQVLKAGSSLGSPVGRCTSGAAHPRRGAWPHACLTEAA